MVVDCGGGTVDITVHEVSNKEGHIKEVFKATGGPYGSISTTNVLKTNWSFFLHFVKVLTKHLRAFSALYLEMTSLASTRERDPQDSLI